MPPRGQAEPSFTMNSLPARRVRPALLVILLIVTGGIGGTVWRRSKARSAAPAFSGNLQVVLRPSVDAKQPISIEEQGALPVRAGGSMTLDARLTQPGFIYLVWLDSEGKAAPLYPWNTEKLEVLDIDAPPPERRATTVLFSPLQVGGAWYFPKTEGVHTVLMLARQTPLPAGTSLAALIAPLREAPQPRSGDELVVIARDRKAKSVSRKALKGGLDQIEAEASAEKIDKLLARLGAEFDVIRAVQFRQQEAPAAEPAASP